MEKSPYAMAKLGLENSTLLRPQRDCGFYAKYVFLFLSLIQFLIILGLVLFMVYGNNRATTEKHLQGMNVWLQECRIQTSALTKEKANLTSLLNASRAESRQITGQLIRLNATGRACTIEKVRLQGQLRQAETAIHNSRVCYENLNYFNATFPDKVKSLEARLKAQALSADLEKKELELENQRLQAQVKKAEREDATCQRDVLQLRMQVRKVGELESQVMREMQTASQNVRVAVEKALPSQAIWNCNTEEVQNLKTTCQNLSKQLEGYVASLGRRLEESVNAMARENAALQKEKEACSQDRQELSNRLTVQEQQATEEKDKLQLACSKEKTRIYSEQQKLFGEKESLRQELDRMKQKCWSAPQPNPAMRVPGISGGTNLLANLPGHFNPSAPVGAPNTFNPPWPRSGALSVLPSAVGDQGPQGSMPMLRGLAPPGNIGSHRPSSRSAAKGVR
ncbi:plasmalemma vesicle-associated protein isoform X2 [Paroedura picta]|uniref:plasmalemma vesicle-associated protein isoform X2 n=1 Tax=Paroedura picta TaxID=143630 RepID=UPI0040575416